MYQIEKEEGEEREEREEAADSGWKMDKGGEDGRIDLGRGGEKMSRLCLPPTAPSLPTALAAVRCFAALRTVKLPTLPPSLPCPQTRNLSFGLFAAGREKSSCARDQNRRSEGSGKTGV